ncbi:MAG TPA: hypothetical protein GXZ74_02815 [Tissierellia bacterium]|nr:hypothetical protein [Tissierellia bacterium]
MEIGKMVVYPMHGAGTIVEVEKEDFYGKEMIYCTLNIVSKEMVLKFPLATADKLKIRDIATTEEILGAMEGEMDREYLTTSNWNKRYQATLDKMKIGTPEEMAQVIVNLKFHDLEKGLSSGERQLYHQAMDILTSEIMLIEDIDYDSAYQKLETKLEEVTSCETPSE